MARICFVAFILILSNISMLGHASRCQRRRNFCEACEGTQVMGDVDQAITSTLAAPIKDQINIALHHLRTSIEIKLSNLRAAHNPVESECEVSGDGSVPRQMHMNDYLRAIFKQITHIAVKTEYADCNLEEGRSGNYDDVRSSTNRVLCALFRRNRTFRNQRKLCSPRYCPLPSQSSATNSQKIEFERCTLIESSSILTGLIASWENCINDNDETYTCTTSIRRRSRRHHNGKLGGRRGRRGRRGRHGRRLRRGRKGNTSRQAMRKRCMKKTGKLRRRCLRKLKKKYNL